MEKLKLNEIAEFLERNPGLADCVVQITYSEVHEFAESFRALEQRAEAAEDNRQSCTNELAEAVLKIDELQTKLEELEKQVPVAWHIYQWRDSPKGWDWYLTKSFSSQPKIGDGWKSVPLFTSPIPPQ